jgi:UDP-GlcNAc3NAcA epimerase
MIRKKIITIIGARPQIIKAAAISRAIRIHFSDKLEEIIVHTGQHYDENMSEVFFTELGIPAPNHNLQIGSGNHGAQTGRMMIGLEEIFILEKPDAVLVYGDTNSTVAGALAAAKIHIPLIHVEAGLRSFNKAMPEELNRIACDHMSTLLFTPSSNGLENLAKEGFDLSTHTKASIDQPNIYHCGDVMYDNSMYFADLSAQKSTILNELGITNEHFILCTIHRDSNTDYPEKLNAIFSALLKIQQDSGWTIILPLHPRARKKMEEGLQPETKALLASNNKIQLIPPTGFLSIIALERNAQLIITDSGGLQKEAFFFGKPCVILREQTEWIEIVQNGNAILTGADEEKIIHAFTTLTAREDFTFPNFYGDAKAAEFICSKIISDL